MKENGFNSFYSQSQTAIGKSSEVWNVGLMIECIDVCPREFGYHSCKKTILTVKLYC